MKEAVGLDNRSAVRSAFESCLAQFDVRPAGSHREHGIDGHVVEVSEPSQRTNFQDVQLAIWSDDVIADVYANDTANDDVMDLIESIARQYQRTMKPTLKMNG